MEGLKETISDMARVNPAPGDYTGEDGLLYCGKCGTPKQVRLLFNPVTNAREETLAAVACACESAAQEKKSACADLERFKNEMRRKWEDGISCPNGLRHTFADDDRANPKVSDACRNYVEHWLEMREANIGILFHGPVGTGKSFYASCIGNGLLEQRAPVAATNFPRLLNLLQGAQDRQRLLDRLAVYKLLIIDDLGVERDSTFAAEQIFNVIDARASSRLPLIVTTNLTMDELERPPTMQYARIYDRVLEMCPVRLKLTGESRRKGNAEERRALARKILLGEDG